MLFATAFASRGVLGVLGVRVLGVRGVRGVPLAGAGCI